MMLSTKEKIKNYQNHNWPIYVETENVGVYTVGLSFNKETPFELAIPKGNRIPDVLSFVVKNKITPEENKVFITNLYNTYINGKPKPSRFGFVGFHDNKEIANIQTYLAKDLNLLSRENVKAIWVILFSDENNILPFEKPEYQKSQFLYRSMIPG